MFIVFISNYILLKGRGRASQRPIKLTLPSLYRHPKSILIHHDHKLMLQSLEPCSRTTGCDDNFGLWSFSLLYRQIHIPQFNLHNSGAIFCYLDKGGQKLNNLYFHIEVLENFKQKHVLLFQNSSIYMVSTKRQSKLDQLAGASNQVVLHMY